jgi:hypothetical protein
MPWALLLPESLVKFWRNAASPPGDNPGLLLLFWAGVVLIFFTITPSRLEYYSLPALAPLALIIGWRIDRYLIGPQDHSLSWGLLALGLLGLGILFLVPFLGKFWAAYRPEFARMIPLIKPTALFASWAVPGAALLGVLLGWRRPWLTFWGYAAVALICIALTYQTLLILSVSSSDKIAGEYLRVHAGTEDLVVLDGVDEFEYAASLVYYSKKRVLIVKRDGLPEFPYPVQPEEDYLISPARLQELWLGPKKVFLLHDLLGQQDPLLQNATVVLKNPGKHLLVNRP